MATFVYGSLMCPEVLQALLQRLPVTQAAVLQGYRRLCILHRPYPAIIPHVSGYGPSSTSIPLTPPKGTHTSRGMRVRALLGGLHSRRGMPHVLTWSWSMGLTAERSHMLHRGPRAGKLRVGLPRTGKYTDTLCGGVGEAQ